MENYRVEGGGDHHARIVDKAGGTVLNLKLVVAHAVPCHHGAVRADIAHRHIRQAGAGADIIHGDVVDAGTDIFTFG